MLLQQDAGTVTALELGASDVEELIYDPLHWDNGQLEPEDWLHVVKDLKLFDY